jgi:hypothetical protein
LILALILGIGLPALFVFLLDRDGFLHGRQDLFEDTIMDGDAPVAQILEQMFRDRAMLKKLIVGQPRLSTAEMNVLSHKFHRAVLTGRVVFPVRDGVDEAPLKRWMKHPELKVMIPNPFVLQLAASSPVGTRTMKRMLKRLYGGAFTCRYQYAKMQVIEQESASIEQNTLVEEDQ